MRWQPHLGDLRLSRITRQDITRALSARILHAAPPATQRPDVPPALDRLLQQCLAKRPEHRPASALELARALQDHVKRETAPYKYPRIVEFTEALPKTASGKVKRAALRGQASSNWAAG